MTAITAAATVMLSACAGTELSDEFVAAEVATTSTSTTTTAPLPPCPLDVADSVSTTSKTVTIPGRTTSGQTVTAMAPTNEPIGVAEDGSFAYIATGFPKGTSPIYVVIRVEGPGCAPVERGVEVVRANPPTSTSRKGKAGNDDYATIPSNGDGPVRVYDPDHRIRNGGSDPEQCIVNGVAYCSD